MGDIAEAMIDGSICSGCGVLLGDPTGYPIKCDDCRDDSPDKKQANMAWSTNHLRELQIGFESKSNGIHLIVECGTEKIDFWPSTGKYIPRVSNKPGRGVRNLVKYIEERKRQLTYLEGK